MEVCLTVSHLDGLVLARSGFHSSVNYRSVMLFGTAEKVADPKSKLAGLEEFMTTHDKTSWMLRASLTN